MAHSKQAKKRIRQNEKNRIRNRTRRSTLKGAMKSVMTAVAAGDKQKATELANAACSKIDKAAKGNTIHKNAAARHKSQVMRALNGMK